MAPGHDNLDDAALVALVLAGEREAFGPLLLRSYASVVRLCRRLLGPTLEAQDVAQEAALQAFLHLARLQEPARFGAWLHAIAANLARMALRHHRTLSLDALHQTRSQALRWVEGIPTPEDAYAAREVHDAVIAALGELSSVNREAVIGFYLDGYSYTELAELLGVPISTVRGRLFQGRYQLKRVLGPLAHEILVPERKQRKEIGMASPELVEVQIGFFGRFEFSTDRLLMLQAVHTNQRLPLHLSAAEADAIEHARDGQQPPQSAAHDLTLRLLAPLGAGIEHVVVHKLVEETFYAQIVLAHGERRFTVDARASDALALAVRSSAPIYAERAILTTAGFDPTDKQQMQEREARHLQQVKQRVAQRADQPARPPVPIALPSEIRQQVNALLARLLIDLGGRTALLMQQSGALVAWQGAGDETTLARYSAARARRDEDLLDLLRFEMYPSDEVEGGVFFRQVGQYCRLEVALRTKPSGDQHDEFVQHMTQAVRALEALLPPPILTSAE